MKLFRAHVGSLILVSMALAACGGGGSSGGGGDLPPSNPTIPLSTVIAGYVDNPFSGTLDVTGTMVVSGQTYGLSGYETLSESTIPGTFEGSPALQKTITETGSVSANGQSAPFAGTTVQYFNANHQPVGRTGAGAYCVTTSATAMPQSAVVGVTGVWYTETCYTSSTKQSVIGTATYTYAVEPDTVDTALLKLITSMDIDGQIVPVTETWRVSSTGSSTRLEMAVAVTSGGDVLNLRGVYR